MKLRERLKVVRAEEDSILRQFETVGRGKFDREVRRALGERLSKLYDEDRTLRNRLYGNECGEPLRNGDI